MSEKWYPTSEDDENEEELLGESREPEESQWFMPEEEGGQGLFSTEGGNDLFDKMMGSNEEEDAEDGEESPEGGIFSRLGETETEDTEDEEGARSELEAEPTAAEDTEGDQEGSVEESGAEAQTVEAGPESEDSHQELPAETGDEAEIPLNSEVSQDTAEEEVQTVEQEAPEGEGSEEDNAEENEAIETEAAEEGGEEAPETSLESEDVATEDSSEAEPESAEAEAETVEEPAETTAEEAEESDAEEGSEEEPAIEEPAETEDEGAVESTEMSDAEEEASDGEDSSEKGDEALEPEPEADEENEPTYEEVEVPLDDVEQEEPSEEQEDTAEEDEPEAVEAEPESAEAEAETDEAVEEPAEATAEEAEESDAEEEEDSEESERKKQLEEIRKRVDTEFQNEAARREGTASPSEKGAEKGLEDYMIDLDTLNMGLLVHYLSKRRDRKLGERIDETNKNLEHLKSEQEAQGAQEGAETVKESTEQPVVSRPEEQIIRNEAQETLEPLSNSNFQALEQQRSEGLSYPDEIHETSTGESQEQSESYEDTTAFTGEEAGAESMTEGNENEARLSEEESFELRQESAGLKQPDDSALAQQRSQDGQTGSSATPISDIIMARNDKATDMDYRASYVNHDELPQEEISISKYRSSIRAGIAAGVSIVGILILYLLLR